MHCLDYQNQQVVKNGKLTPQDGTSVQEYLCKTCRKQFNARTEGMSVRATVCSFGKFHSTIIRWDNG
ncbi:MAG: hypothetical protein KME12_27290 [Trichocoleus desertorum ATA4-8-CV12]|nr:hypothetical protein [Trichocoleus desertorum ATA4-8-CV12]